MIDWVGSVKVIIDILFLIGFCFLFLSTIVLVEYWYEKRTRKGKDEHVKD